MVNMERVRKTFFDPLATTKQEIKDILQPLPAGSAHPFSPEQVLLCRTQDGIEEIDISSYPEDFFYNAIDLGEMGEVLLRRMAKFQSHLAAFQDFQIVQAPSATFQIPIVSNEITILAVSERTPTYWDFCFANRDCDACCWLARDTFPGITHSGDILDGRDLLDYVKINKDTLTREEICVFISGYQSTHISRFMGTHPALMVADHVDKVLYLIPVPLDAATLGSATICCPLVIKGDGGDFLTCSVLPAATTDRDMMCHSNKTHSAAFPEAIRRANFTITAPEPDASISRQRKTGGVSSLRETGASDIVARVVSKKRAIFVANSVPVPPFLDHEDQQVIRFGKGIQFELPDEEKPSEMEPSGVVLPCIFGSQLQGPVLLATGSVPVNAPFVRCQDLLDYYNQLESAVVIVDERMTDNARNLATTLRINALFIVQSKAVTEPEGPDALTDLLNSTNVNAVTALAGPQSLVLVNVMNRFYYYRGFGNAAHFNASELVFGQDVTSTITQDAIDSILDPRVSRTIDLAADNKIILPGAGQWIEPQTLPSILNDLPIDKVESLRGDISAAVPQLQMLLQQKDIQNLSQTLVGALSTKISDRVAPHRKAYIEFLTKEHQAEDPESVKKKNQMLGYLRRMTKDLQKAYEPIISQLVGIVSGMMSARATSKRTHDLKRLVRQTQIQSNVEAARSMTFDTLAGHLEEHASDMGVMLLNINTHRYQGILETLGGSPAAASMDVSSSCDLDSRVLHLAGFDAGIIMEQSQNEHYGPLRSSGGPTSPVLSLPYLNPAAGSGSMLAWVCWDEFVNLQSPYSVRWMEKCNESHIASARILMRSTLSNAIASREFNLQPGSPETGHLMSALLMAAMSKLATMRTTVPVETKEANDTVVKLMRGLFGNLLTIAGSGVRPLSMVWQLFGLNPQYDVPARHVDWVWYEKVVALYPYTGWTRTQFNRNLERLLDKVIVRVVVKAEEITSLKSQRLDEMIQYCKLRNIQLQHSRTIVTVLMRMLQVESTETAAIATRMLDQLPLELETQTSGYSKTIKYLKHLAKGGQRRTQDDTVIANTFTQRSADFSHLKNEVAQACKSNEWTKVKAPCQAILDKHTAIAAALHINPESLKVQNIQVYRDLLAADLESFTNQDTELQIHELTRRVLSDAERKRVPWQVGKEGQFGEKIEPLDEDFVHEILTGQAPQKKDLVEINAAAAPTETAVAITASQEDMALDFAQFASTIKRSFLERMQDSLAAENVCNIMGVPSSAMKVFVTSLNPDFVWEELAPNFKAVMLDLLKERSKRLESRPVQKLLQFSNRRGQEQIEGA